MTLKEQINAERLPKHVAVIMDGNGRWAQKKGNQRIFGHKNGVKAVREIVEGAGEIGIRYLTLYAFSTENWSRPKTEIDALMSLLITTINSETENLLKNNVRLLTIGNLGSLPENVVAKLKETEERTSRNTGLTVIMAISYSSRWEIVNAVKNIAHEIEAGRLSATDIDCDIFRSFLNTANIPDPELLIRTSGELRLSNFLLWQLAYAELYFTNVLWPDFRRENLYEAIVNFQNRERRFGKTGKQIDEDAKVQQN